MGRSLLIGIVLVEVGLLGIGLRYGISPLLLAIAFFHPIMFLGVYLALRVLRFADCDINLPLSLTLILTGIGLFILYRVDSASGVSFLDSFAFRQLIAIGIGLVVLVASAVLFQKPNRIERTAPWLLVGGMILVGLTLVWGREAGGARAWLTMGDWSLQPSEILKFGIVVFLSTYLARLHLHYGETVPPDWWQKPQMLSAYLIPLFCMEVTALFLVVLQRDLGMGLIYFCLFLLLMYEATSQKSIVGLGFAIGVVGLLVAAAIYPHVGLRLSVWLDPWSKAQGSGYQMVQSLLAIRSGGFFGRGIGEGLPIKIPAAHTDFVFSLWAEEMGFLGCVALGLLFLFLVLYSLNRAQRVHNPVQKLAAVGVAGLFGLQTLIIIGGCIGLLPLTGVTLPLVSYGGSSLVCSLAAVGLLLSIRDGGCMAYDDE